MPGWMIEKLKQLREEQKPERPALYIYDAPIPRNRPEPEPENRRGEVVVDYRL